LRILATRKQGGPYRLRQKIEKDATAPAIGDAPLFVE
jgi:hypothetical protein